MDDLLDLGVSIHAVDEDGKFNNNKNSLLHIAVMVGNIQLIELLLSKGASIRQRNKEGKTALDLAKELGEIEIIELLNRYLHNSNFRYEIKTEEKHKFGGFVSKEGFFYSETKNLEEKELLPAFKTDNLPIKSIV